MKAVYLREFRKHFYRSWL